MHLLRCLAEARKRSFFFESRWPADLLTVRSQLVVQLSCDFFPDQAGATMRAKVPGPLVNRCGCNEQWTENFFPLQYQ